MTRILQRLLGGLLALTLALPAFPQGKISADPTASALAGSEYLAGVQSGANVKVLPSQISTLTLTGPTTTGKLTTAASGTGTAGFRLPHGTAPTSPVDGDVWTTSAGGLYARINGATVGPLSTGTGTVTSVAASVPSFLSIAGSPVTSSGTLAITLSGTALPVANGGTGITSFGTGIATALGVNVGSAGAPVLYNGAGGTPSALVLTNATGLPGASLTGAYTASGLTMATSRLLGRTTASSGAAEEITVGTGLSMSGGTLTATGSGGTVTATGGSLTSNSVVLGAGSTDTKVVAGITTDGTSVLTLGVAGSSVGSVALKNATSGTLTLAPPTGALGTVTVTVPAATDTLVNLTGTQTLTNKTLTSPIVGTQSANDNSTKAASTAYVDGKTTPVLIQVAASDETTALTTGTKVTFRAPYAFTLSSVRGSLTTAQSAGSLLVFNVKKGGTTVFSTTPTFDNTEKTTTTAATASVLSTTAISDDDEITITIDTVGTSGAAGLKVTLIGTKP